MVEVVLEGAVAGKIEEATVQSWFVEEGDPINEGDDLVELVTERGVITITAPISGILSEVYFDEGEAVSKGEILCTIDDEESEEEDDDEEESDDDEDEDEEDE